MPFTKGTDVTREQLSNHARVVPFLDNLKKNAGNFVSVELIGSATCGTVYQKNGYFIKYENLTIFTEFIITKKTNGYELQYSKARCNLFTPNFIGDIPDYCWKTKSTPNQRVEATAATPD